MKKKNMLLLAAILLCVPVIIDAQEKPDYMVENGLEVYAQTARVILDNDSIKITEYTSQPGQDVCGRGKHTHGNHALFYSRMPK